MSQLIAHLFGDFICQSSWMASHKSERSWPCLVHVLLYTACFLFVTRSWEALAVIGSTHFVIDRFGLARYLMWAKNHLSPGGYYPPWFLCWRTGYYDENAGNFAITDRETRMARLDESNAKVIGGINEASLHRYAMQPAWLSLWLTIVADNALHLLINYEAIKWLS